MARPSKAIWPAALVIAMAAAPSPGADLALPTTARLVAEDVQSPGRVQLPVSPWNDGRMERVTAEGALRRQAWQVPAPGRTTLQLLAPLREQLAEDGYELLFECAAQVCGGFEFRYELPLSTAPDMHVDLGDYRYLVARRPGDPGEDIAALLVSRSAGRGFVQLIEILPGGASGPSTPGPALAEQVPAVQGPGVDAPEVSANGPLAARLLSDGHAVLEGLGFRTGSADLEDRDFAALAETAAFLQSHPEARILLVGHSDTEGALEANVALSQKRAAAVMDRLQARHGIAAERMRAEGVGYLAPLTSNATTEGRLRNRRVEVVLSEPVGAQ